MSDVMELLKFCTSNFWVFCGVVILIYAIGETLATVLGAILLGIFHRNGDVHIGSKTEQIISKTDKNNIENNIK